MYLQASVNLQGYLLLILPNESWIDFLSISLVLYIVEISGFIGFAIKPGWTTKWLRHIGLVAMLIAAVSVIMIARTFIAPGSVFTKMTFWNLVAILCLAGNGLAGLWLFLKGKTMEDNSG